ncbi:MAG: DUF1992 domain-containing protein [Acidobacteriota bacterium]
MSWEKLVEQKIKEAMEAGEFDDLPRGKPLDLSAYFATPEEVRVSYSILKNAGVVPQEVELLGEIVKLKESLEGCADEEQRKEIVRRIDELTLKYNLLMEHSKGSRQR